MTGLTVATETSDTGADSAAGRIQYWLACIFVYGWTGIICAGLGVQFISWDYPCPLCIVQRMFMALTALGAGYIVRKGMTGTITAREYMTGWGLAIVGCVAGGFAAWRQTMLHILPGDSAYGAPVLGLHMYVWAWILFVVALATVGVVLTISEETTAAEIPATPHRMVGRIALWFLGVVLAVNMVAVFLEQGLHWFLPDDPNRYQFFYDVGILG